MPRAFTPKVVTANDLRLGDVVYQTRDGWTRSLSEAEILSDEADAELRLLEASAQTQTIVGAYLADVLVENDRPQPAHFREAFRAKGPSNYLHGKQEHL